MWKSRLSIIGLIVVLIGSATLITWFLISPSIDQTKVPLFIATLSSLFSATGVIASWLVVLEMQHDRESLFKPDVYADFEAEEGLFTFVVRNDGQSAAKKVRVIIDPIPIGSNDQPINNVEWLREPIETLLPGKRLEKRVGSHLSVFNNKPLEFTVTVTYQSLSGKKYFEGPYVIDLAEYRNTTIPTQSLEKSLSAAAKSLNDIADKLEKITNEK